jgi:hypothetical protein
VKHFHKKKGMCAMTQQDAIQLLRTIFPLLLPVLLIQLGVVVYALVGVLKSHETRGPRWLWIFLLILGAFTVPGGIIVAGIYLSWGRKVPTTDDQG